MPQLETSVVYTYPTVLSLINAMQKIYKGGSISASLVPHTDADSILSTIAEYSATIDLMPEDKSAPAAKNSGNVYLLTGSTGFLGSYILESLLGSGASHVFCLNRSTDSGMVQRKRSLTRGLTTDLRDDQVTFLTADLSDPSFGVDAGMFSKMIRSVTHIVHNAWPVDFNIPLSAFNPQLQGIVNLLSFANAAPQSPSLLYISSISAVSHLE
jgi:hypothetical protein